MDIKFIKELAELMAEHSLSNLDFEHDGIKLRLSKDSKSVVSQPTLIQQHSLNEQNQHLSASINTDVAVRTIDSKMVGVFYESASPESSPFVEAGQKVSKGQILCIIEAMKTMNEIVAEHDCEIVEICVKNAQLVDYGQSLFVIK
ncbi:MAG: acetyl-CoA carboxylase biotin carboxyl carrier protein [Clostridiales bacterium]|jgi:acetyl-CoA carboxylase biotin carboxyl carrier protein|nr:acetyl-CoA carboxylase biotin carboxyl carrier protein [Clostridiales bacterium]